MTPGTRELLAAILEALDVPDAEREPVAIMERLQLLEARCIDIRVVCNQLVAYPPLAEEVGMRARWLREWTAQRPATYSTREDET